MMPKFTQIVLLAAIVITGCAKAGTDSQSASLSKKYGFPVTLSSMNGWHGLHVVRKTFDDGSPPQCRLEIPSKFGRSPAERYLLNYLAINQFVSDLAGEGNCYATNIIYEALDQLRLLAGRDQNSEAARLLLYEGSSDMPFNLDGSVAESYTESYLLPVLENYRNLRSILDSKRETYIAKDICGDLSWRQEVRDTKTRRRVATLIAHLKDAGMKPLAEKIINTCATLHVIFPHPVVKGSK